MRSTNVLAFYNNYCAPLNFSLIFSFGNSRQMEALCLTCRDLSAVCLRILSKRACCWGSTASAGKWKSKKKKCLKFFSVLTFLVLAHIFIEDMSHVSEMLRIFWQTCHWFRSRNCQYKLYTTHIDRQQLVASWKLCQTAEVFVYYKLISASLLSLYCKHEISKCPPAFSSVVKQVLS